MIDIQSIRRIFSRQNKNKLKNKNMKITKEGFIWKIVNNEAKEIYNNGIFELYLLHEPDGGESLIETDEELSHALDSGLDIGIEVGYYPEINKINTLIADEKGEETLRGLFSR